MLLIPSKFKLDEEISLVGNPMRVAGILQLEGPAEQVATRYLLTGATGTTQILEERGDAFALLRPFPPAAQPQAAGNSISVMGERYTLAGVSRLKVLGAQGESPGGTIASPVLVSGRFEGAMGELVREIVPGANAQAYYSVKAVSAADVMTCEQIAAAHAEAAREREQHAQAEAETEDEGGWAKKIGGWVVSLLVVLGLAFACSDSDDSGSGSARSVTVRSGGGFHGK